MAGRVNKKLTLNQQQVLSVLDKAARPMGAYALLNQLTGSGFRAPMQVYRALNRLVEFGLVHKLESLNAYISCSDSQHHASRVNAYTICQCCGQTEELDANDLGTGLQQQLEQRAFTPERTSIEIVGCCPECSDKSNKH